MHERQQDSPHFYIRFINAAAENSPVDIYANDKIVAANLHYAECSGYLKGCEGNYDFQIYKTGKTELEEEIVLDENIIYTLAASGYGQHLELSIIPDTHRDFDANYAHMRFIHLSHNCPSVNIIMDEQSTVEDLLYKEISEYIAFSPGQHSLAVYPIRSNTPILINPNAALQAGKHYSAYLIGSPSGQPPLQTAILLEGVTYQKF